MFKAKQAQHYTMNEQQFEEMKKFYQTLGYDERQVKKLCENCFGAKVKIDKHTGYSENWTFYRKTVWDQSDGFFSRRKSSGNAMPGMMGMAMAGSAMPKPMEDVMMPMGMAMMNMAKAAPVVADGEVMDGACEEVCAEPTAAEEPSTAETHNVRENEEHSPLDAGPLIFSANVNSASWTYLRSRVARHHSVDPSFVRIEEILNSYAYDLPAPKEELFSVSAESGPCPWNEESELLFLGFKGKKADINVHQNLALLVDVSGSMEDNWIMTQMSIAAIMSQLKKGDIVSIIAYSDDTITVVKELNCGNKDKCVEAILSIDGIGGCTNGSDGLENAYRYLKDNFDERANNRVFIFTDGDFNFGITSEGGLEKFIYDKRQTGIYLSIVGYGEGNFKDNKMETLARNGNGNYTFIANPADIMDNLFEKLTSNLITVAKDVKISVEFNPAYVKEYRLVGYDARMLTQKEFHDTEKATDGIGSEHNVAALVELKRGTAQQRYKSRYVQVNAQEGGDELAFVEVHYKSPEGENLVMTKSITLDDLQSAGSRNIGAAALLASFGLMVKRSAYKGTMTGSKLLEMTSALMKEKGIETPARYSHFDIIRKFAVDI